jgi:hypothetical protein
MSFIPPSEQGLNVPRRAQATVAGQHQEHQLRCAPLLFASQVPAQSVVPQGIPLGIFGHALEQLGMSAQQGLAYTPLA